MRKFFTKHRWVGFMVLICMIGFGSLYSNCGTVENEVLGDQYRQKIFIDEVHDVFPAQLCDEDCEGDNADGTLKDVEFE